MTDIDRCELLVIGLGAAAFDGKVLVTDIDGWES